MPFRILDEIRIKHHKYLGEYFAPKHVHRKSQKVIAINKKLIAAVNAGRAPATLAREECIREGRFYVGKDGKQHAEWPCFVAKLKKYMTETIRGGA